MCLHWLQEHDYCSVSQWGHCPEPETGTRVFLCSDFQETWTTSGLISWSQEKGLWDPPAQESSWKRNICFCNIFCFINALSNTYHLTEENLSAFNIFSSGFWPLTYFEWFTQAIHCLGMLALAKNPKSLKINTTGLSSHSNHCWLHISHTVQQDMLN